MNEQTRDNTNRLAGLIETRVKSWHRQRPAPAAALGDIQGWQAEATRLGADIGALVVAEDLVTGVGAAKGLPLEPEWGMALFTLQGAADVLRESTHEEGFIPLDMQRNRAALKSTSVKAMKAGVTVRAILKVTGMISRAYKLAKKEQLTDSHVWAIRDEVRRLMIASNDKEVNRLIGESSKWLRKLALKMNNTSVRYSEPLFMLTTARLYLSKAAQVKRGEG